MCECAAAEWRVSRGSLLRCSIERERERERIQCPSKLFEYLCAFTEVL